VGTSSPTAGYGGFVLSAASDSINLLLRTLQDANRLQILSRPQIMTMDNTEGFVQVGRQIARVTGIQNLGNGQSQVITEDIEVGLIMNVRPRVGSDGLIVMDVDATRSDRDPNNGTIVPTGDATGSVVQIDDILRTTAQSVVAAYSGQTVVFGGLIQKTRGNFSRRVPFVADIPLIGHLFKFDQETERRSELLVIMTPMLITGEEDLDYVKEVESSRMSWCLADVVEAHGDVGLSGGYGLWGPAVGNTIYPDLQPTVENVVVHDNYPNVEGSGFQGSSIQGSSVVHEEMNEREVIQHSDSMPQHSMPQVPVESVIEDPNFGTPVGAQTEPTPSATTQASAIEVLRNTALQQALQDALQESEAVVAESRSSNSDVESLSMPATTETTNVRPDLVPGSDSPAEKRSVRRNAALPTPVTIPQANLNRAGTIQQSSYRMGRLPSQSNAPALTKQASWIDQAKRTISNPKPLRLGAGESLQSDQGMLDSE
jgi:hypothetical protein